MILFAAGIVFGKTVLIYGLDEEAWRLGSNGQ
jgi:hypothetical protein